MTTDSKSERVVRLLSATYFETGPGADGGTSTYVRTAQRGQTVCLSDHEEKRLDGLGALLPKGSKPEDAEEERAAIQDAYRGVRGDAEAAQRHLQRTTDGAAGIVNVDAPALDAASVGSLSEWIKSEKPNVDDTVALAENDPAKARKVLEAETSATGGSPRAGVESKLQKIIDG